jgi:hypothetical protein
MLGPRDSLKMAGALDRVGSDNRTSTLGWCLCMQADTSPHYADIAAQQLLPCERLQPVPFKVTLLELAAGATPARIVSANLHVHWKRRSGTDAARWDAAAIKWKEQGA